MYTRSKNTTWAGIFFIIATAAPILTVSFIGFLGGGVAGELIPDYLNQISANENSIIIAMFIELIWALAVVGIVVTLFPILKMVSEVLALSFSALRFIEAICNFFHLIILLGLLTLSQEYAAAGFPAASYFQTAGNLFLALREWTFLIGAGLVWSLSALILNYILYQGRLVPRWLSAWGVIGAALSLANYLPEFFGIDSVEILFLPIALQEMVFALWLIIKGVKTSAIMPDTVVKDQPVLTT